MAWRRVADAVGLQGLQRRGRVRQSPASTCGCSSANSFLFADVARVAPPAVAKLLQDAAKSLPVAVQAVRSSAAAQASHLVDQMPGAGPCAQRLARLHLLEPGLHHFVGLVAGGVKALPQRVVGRPPWSVRFHCSRRLRSCSCILRPPMACPCGRCEQNLRPWPAISRSWSARQRRQPSSSRLRPARCGRVPSSLASASLGVLLEHRAQGRRRASGCPAVPLRELLLQPNQRLGQLSAWASPGTEFRGFDLGPGGFGCALVRRPPARGGAAHRPTRAPAARAHRGRHWRRWPAACKAPECLAHHQQLRARGVRRGRKPQVHAGPVQVLQQCYRLGFASVARRRAGYPSPHGRRPAAWWTAPRCAGPTARPRLRVALAPGAAGLRRTAHPLSNVVLARRGERLLAQGCARPRPQSRCHAIASAMLSLGSASSVCALLAQSAASASCSLARRASSSFSRTVRRAFVLATELPEHIGELLGRGLAGNPRP